MSELQRKPPLLLDGAAGTEFMKLGLPAGVCVEQWLCEHPEAIHQVVLSYASAGSDIVYAPTFLANRGNLALYGLEDKVQEFNTKIVKEAQKALTGHSVLLAGDISTTGLMCEPFGETPFSHLLEVYREQGKAQAEAGVDLFVVETMSSFTECRAAVLALREFGLPILLTMTVDAQGHTMWGDNLLASMIVLQDLGIAGFGLNCSHGPEAMLPLIEEIAPYAKIPLITKPNAGEPPLTPVQFSDRCAALMRKGVKIIGGCCGTDPEYIALLRRMVDSFDIDRVIIPPAECDIIVASRNVYYLDDSMEFSEPVTCSMDMANELLEAAEEGCDAVLIHLDTPDDGYAFSLNAHMIDLPVAFESESLEALDSALLLYQGKALIASTNCEIEREDLEKIAVRYGAVVM